MDSEKIITVLEMLSASLETEAAVRRVRGWIAELSEQTTTSLAAKSPSVKDPKQMLIDTRRNLLREAKRIEANL